MTKNEPDGEAVEINKLKANLPSGKDSTAYASKEVASPTTNDSFINPSTRNINVGSSSLKSEDKNDTEKIAKKESLERRCQEIRRQLDSQPDKITLIGLIEELRSLASEAREAGITISGLKEATSVIAVNTENLSRQAESVNISSESKKSLDKEGEYDLNKMSREDISKVYANSNKLSEEYFEKHNKRMAELDTDIALMKDRDLTDEELRKRLNKTPEQKKQLKEERDVWQEMERAAKLAAKESAALLQKNQEHDEEIARLKAIHLNHPEIENLETKKAKNHEHLAKAKVVLDTQDERHKARDEEALELKKGLDNAVKYKRTRWQKEFKTNVEKFEFKHQTSHAEIVKAAKKKLEANEHSADNNRKDLKSPSLPTADSKLAVSSPTTSPTIFVVSPEENLQASAQSSENKAANLVTIPDLIKSIQQVSPPQEKRPIKPDSTPDQKPKRVRDTEI